MTDRDPIYDMELHDTLELPEGDTLVLRVSGGWIYTQYHMYRSNTVSEYQTRATSTFVPWYKVKEPAKV